MDLFDFLDTAPQLCEHVYAVGSVKGDSWTKEHDPESKWFGHYVHANPDCRRPAHLIPQGNPDA